jgi:hypothetical protein
VETERLQAIAIISALRAFREDIRELMDAIADRAFIPRDEKSELQAKFKDLKGRLKKASHLGTVDGAKRPLSQLESAYYQPATQSAFVNCLVAVNTDPIRSNWHSYLYGMEMDIQHLVGQLETNYPDV